MRLLVTGLLLGLAATLSGWRVSSEPPPELSAVVVFEQESEWSFDDAELFIDRGDGSALARVGAGRSPTLSADRRYVVYASGDEDLVEADIHTGAKRVLADGLFARTPLLGAPLLSADGRRALVVTWPRRGGLRLVTVDRASGRARTVRRGPGVTALAAIAPDGRSFAALEGTRRRTTQPLRRPRIAVRQVDGGTLVWRRPAPVKLNALAWPASGLVAVEGGRRGSRLVRFARTAPRPVPFTRRADLVLAMRPRPGGSVAYLAHDGRKRPVLREVDARTGKPLHPPRSLDLDGRNLAGCEISPDGTRVLATTTKARLIEVDVTTGTRRTIARDVGHFSTGG